MLGTLAAFALYRASFFGRTMISFLFILPIALPGIITGMALNSYFTYWGRPSASGRSSSATPPFAS